MTKHLNFDIIAQATISRQFLERKIFTFNEAADFVRQLAYRRNTNKYDLTTVFSDHCGTCSTKHALLYQLSIENNCSELRLIMGVFRMNAKNTPKIAATLAKYGLEYMPEAHNYLKYKNQILDFTHKTSKPSDFENDLIQEIEIQPNQITDFKVAYHKHYLAEWIATQNINYTHEELWQIREQCITDLSKK